MLHPHPYSRLWSLAASVALILPMVQAQVQTLTPHHITTSHHHSQLCINCSPILPHLLRYLFWMVTPSPNRDKGKKNYVMLVPIPI